MKKITFLISLFYFCQTATAQRGDPYVYIEKYKTLAMAEMERAGIPASIKLAQGILESGAGGSTLARKANNHFGIKCHSMWKGPTYYVKDDDYDENGKLIESCFRSYKNAKASYLDHSSFLRKKRYESLFRLSPRDYKGWAYGLKNAGYATSATYAEKLVRVIETYELYQYDISNPDIPVVDNNADKTNTKNKSKKVLRNNDVKMVYAQVGDTPEQISARFKVAISRIMSYNEKLKGEDQILKEGEPIYLTRKKGFLRSRSGSIYHFVKAGETMYSISQRYGIRLSKLYRKNRMTEGTEPAVGEKLKLRWRVPKGESPKLRSKNDNDIPIAGNGSDGDNPTGNNNNNNSNDRFDDDDDDIVFDTDDDGTSPFEKPNPGDSSADEWDIPPPGSTNNNSDDSVADDNDWNDNPSNNDDSWGNSNTNNNDPWSDNSSENNNNWETTNSENPDGPAWPNENTSNNGNGNWSDTPADNSSTNTNSNDGPTWPSGNNTNTSDTWNDNSSNETPSQPTGSAYYTVKKGDTLYRISVNYGTSVAELKRLNGLTSNLIRPNQQLRIR